MEEKPSSQQMLLELNRHRKECSSTAKKAKGIITAINNDGVIASHLVIAPINKSEEEVRSEQTNALKQLLKENYTTEFIEELYKSGNFTIINF